MLVLEQALGNEFNVVVCCLKIKLSSTPFRKVLLAASIVLASDRKEIIASN